MTTEELYGHIQRILIDELGAETAGVTPAATYDALGLDSLDVVEMILIVEENFGIRIDDEELEHIHTLQQLAEALAAKSQVAA